MDGPLRFDRFELQPARRRLLADGRPLELGARALDLLIVLVRRAGALVSKQELLDQVWPDAAVEEANLHVQVFTLRKLLGRGAIATVPGRGYQFVLPLLPPPPLQAPADAAAEAPPGAGLPPLLGREAELARLGEALARGGFVTVTGAGGSGKTLLARHFAARQAPAAVWVDLVEIDDPAAVVPAVGQALGAHGPPRSAAALAAALAGAQGLLVLDNAEHLLDVVRELAQALRAQAPGWALLLTSQAPLRSPGEQVLPLGGLAWPAGPCSAAEALRHAAVALFVAHARQADRRFRFAEAQVDDVVALCASLDGSALGLQLAAAQLGSLPLAAVRERLARRETGPEAAAVDASANVLRAALAASHELLAAAPRRVFRRLAIAQGPLALPLVQALVAEGAGPEAEDEVAEALADLVERALVQCEGEAEGLRYRLLEAPRALALEQLALAGEREALRSRFAQALAPLGDAVHAAEWSGHAAPTGADLRAAAAPVAADLVAAFEAALALPPPTGAALAARLSDALLRVALVRPGPQRLAWATRLREAAATAGLAPSLRGRALDGVAGLLRHSDLPARLQDLQQAAAAWREAGDLLGEFRALARAADCAALLGRADEAAALLARVRALEDPAWPPGRRRWRWFAEGVVAVSAGDLPRAIAAWQTQLSLVQDWSHERAQALHSLANAEQIGGDAAAARPRLLEAVAIARQLRAQAMLHAFLLPNLLAAELALGDVAAARAAAAEGWPRARQQDAEAWWADHLALLAAREGRLHTAARLLGLADAGYARLHDQRQALEQQAEAAAAALARAALGEAAFAALRAEAPDAEALAAAALAAGDGPPPVLQPNSRT